MTPRRWPLAIGILPLSLTLALAACGQEEAEAVADPPAVVEEVTGSELNRITLTARAVERLGIETAVVQDLSVPYSAVFYTSDGATWAYVSPEEFVFVRERIVVDRIHGDVAVLTDGPRPGTTVVAIGAAELYGAETGVGGGH